LVILGPAPNRGAGVRLPGNPQESAAKIHLKSGAETVDLALFGSIVRAFAGGIAAGGARFWAEFCEKMDG